MLQCCLVAGLDQCTEEAIAVGEQGHSFAPGVVRGEEGKRVRECSLCSVIFVGRENSWSFKSPVSQYHLTLCKWPHRLGSPCAFVHHWKNQAVGWLVASTCTASALWKAILVQCRLMGSILTQWIAGLTGKITHIPDKVKIGDTLSQT